MDDLRIVFDATHRGFIQAALLNIQLQLRLKSPRGSTTKYGDLPSFLSMQLLSGSNALRPLLDWIDTTLFDIIADGRDARWITCYYASSRLDEVWIKYSTASIQVGHVGPFIRPSFNQAAFLYTTETFLRLFKLIPEYHYSRFQQMLRHADSDHEVFQLLKPIECAIRDQRSKGLLEECHRVFQGQEHPLTMDFTKSEFVLTWIQKEYQLVQQPAESENLAKPGGMDGGCPITLDTETRKAYVDGQPIRRRLTREQVKVVQALIAAWPNRLAIDEVRGIPLGDALGVFKRLIKVPPWCEYLSLAGDKGNGYGWIHKDE